MTYLDEVEARAAAATPGPWTPLGSTLYPDEDESALPFDVHRPADAAFIAAAREDIPRLGAALRAVLALCDDLTQAYSTVLFPQQTVEEAKAALAVAKASGTAWPDQFAASSGRNVVRLVRAAVAEHLGES